MLDKIKRYVSLDELGFHKRTTSGRLDYEYQELSFELGLRDSVIYHGGCHGCLTPLNKGLKRCNGCQFKYANWSLPNRYCEEPLFKEHAPQVRKELRNNSLILIENERRIYLRNRAISDGRKAEIERQFKKSLKPKKEFCKVKDNYDTRVH